MRIGGSQLRSDEANHSAVSEAAIKGGSNEPSSEGGQQRFPRSLATPAVFVCVVSNINFSYADSISVCNSGLTSLCFVGLADFV